MRGEQLAQSAVVQVCQSVQCVPVLLPSRASGGSHAVEGVHTVSVYQSVLHVPLLRFASVVLVFGKLRLHLFKFPRLHLYERGILLVLLLQSVKCQAQFAVVLKVARVTVVHLLQPSVLSVYHTPVVAHPAPVIDEEPHHHHDEQCCRASHLHYSFLVAPFAAHAVVVFLEVHQLACRTGGYLPVVHAVESFAQEQLCLAVAVCQ